MDVNSDDLARRAQLEVSIDGHDATSALEPYVTSFEFTDHAEGKSDEISLELHDRDDQWIGGWMPAKGARITASIRYLNWWGPGVSPQLNCGVFTCDESSYSGPPGKVVIKAVSASLSGPLRETTRNQAWEEFSLRGVAEDVAKRNGLSLYYDADAYQFARQDQRGESDLAFLQRLATDKGVNVKVRDDKLILFSASGADARGAALTFSRRGEGYNTVSDFDFKTKSEGTAYKACTVEYYDPTSGELIVYTYNPENVEMTEATATKALDVDHRVENEADARALAQNKLRGVNKGEVTGNFTVMDNPGLVAGITVAMTDFGTFSGKYFVNKTVHSLAASTAKAEIRRVLGY